MKKIKNKIREHKAITLIALVITIIVLLILAGITVAQLSGNNLFENAKLAKEKYKKSKELEDEIIGDYEDAITGDRGNKLNFTTEEQVVGTWINGKPIYQKVVEIKTVLASDDVITVSQNIDELIDYGGQGYYRTAKLHRPFPWVASGNQAQLNGINDSRTGFLYYCDSATNNMQPGSKIWFQYTKTTD